MSTSDSKSRPDRIARTLRDVPRSGIRDFFEIVSSMQGIISLGIGEPDFVTPWHVREASIFALEKGATSYTSNLGLLKLRRAIAGYVRRTFHADYDPETEILVTVGVSEALDLAVRALVNPGDEVMYHEPCYVSYRPLIQLAHGVPVVIETDRAHAFRLSRDALEKKVSPRTRLLILNYPNNPTGAALTRNEVEEIARFAIAHDLIVIADDIYAELSYEEPHISIASMPGMKERTIFLHGFSKAWAMTGFRIGYACAPPDLTDAMMKIHQYTMLCAPILSQEAAVEALAQPDVDVAEMRSEYLKRRNYVFRSLEEMGLPCVRLRGAFYAFPYIGDTGLSSRDFALKLLEQHQVAVVPGSAFGSCGEGHIRCSYATSLDEIKIAMDRMAVFVGEHAPALRKA